MTELPVHVVMHTLPDFEVGGGQRLLLRILQNMPDPRFRHVICSLGDGPMRTDFDRAGIATHVIGYGGMAKLPATVRAFAACIRRENVSVLHTNSRLDRIVGHLAGRLTGTPVVTTYHSIVAQAGMTYPAWVRPMIRLLIRFMNIVLARMGVKAKVAVSKAVVASRAKDLCCPESDFLVIYPGLSSDAFADPPSPEARQTLLRSLDAEEASPVLICIGRIVKQKGQHLLVRMLPRLRAKWPALCLLIVGDGKDGQYLREEIEALGVGTAVRMLGMRDDIPELIAASDMLIHASLSEGFGLVVLEGMAGGKPVVATNLPSIAEFVEDGVTAVLVDPPSPQAFADAIESLLSDPARCRAIGDAGREVAERFDVRNMAAELAGTYGKIVREPAA